MTLKFSISVVKVLQLKIKKILGLIPTFVEVTGKNWWGRGLFATHPEYGKKFHCFDIWVFCLIFLVVTRYFPVNLILWCFSFSRQPGFFNKINGAGIVSDNLE